MKTKSPALKHTDWYGFRWYDFAFFGTVFVLAFAFFSHPDLWETANHSYVLLESIFKGDFFGFYETVAAHENTYYYINNAHYNIFIYLLFGLWELPVFLFNQLFGLALNETFLIYWAKLLSVGFFVGCGYWVRRICLALGLHAKYAFAAAAFFLLQPVAFFSPMLMGQYDSLCLFFTLWALYWYVKKDYTRFAVLVGVGAVCKFFPLLLFVPLILLAEKRVLHVLRYAAISLWLYVPTTLLFWGRTGNAQVFTQLMIDRMFEQTIPTGMQEMSVFTVCYLLVVLFAFFYAPKTELQHNSIAMYLCLAVYGLLFCTILWHPQWVLLVVPFMVITTFQQENKTPWFYIDLLFCAGFFLHAFYIYPNQMGAVLLDGGLYAHLTGVRVALSSHWQLISFFLEKIPYVYVLTPVLFSGALVANIVFKLPVGGQSVADKISLAQRHDKLPLKVFWYGVFLVGLCALWLMPVLLEAWNALGNLSFPFA